MYPSHKYKLQCKFAFVGALCVLYFGDDSPAAWEQLWAFVFLGLAVLVLGCLVWSIKSYLCDAYIWETNEEDATAEEMLANSACLRCCIPKSWQDTLLSSDAPDFSDAPEFGRGHAAMQQRRSCDEGFNAAMEKAMQGQATEMVQVQSVSEVELEVGTANTAQSAADSQMKHLQDLQMEASKGAMGMGNAAPSAVNDQLAMAQGLHKV